jgi:hypothetical protein
MTINNIDVRNFYHQLTNIMDISSIVHNEQNRLNQKSMGIKTALDSQNRMIFLNQSYTNRMKEYSFMIMIISITIVIIVFILVFKSILPSFITTALIMIVGIIGFLWALSIYNGIIRRDSVDFDKIYSNSGNLKDISGNSFIQGNVHHFNFEQIYNTFSGNLICGGNACCSTGTTYNEQINRCAFTSIEQAYNNGEFSGNLIPNYNYNYNSLSFDSYP